MYLKMYKNNMNSIVILFLMIITGFIIYYMHLKPESFVNCITNPSDPSCIPTTTLAKKNSYCTDNPTDPSCISTSTSDDSNNNSYDTIKDPLSIVSRFFGIGFNIHPVRSSLSDKKLYLIEHIPITADGISGGYYAISNDGLFTIKIKNNDDSAQWWTCNNMRDSSTNTNYDIVQPFSNNSLALQYANGSLSITPYTYPGFESQKWIKSKNSVTRGIPVLNVNPASMFTTEFDPYSSPNSISTNLSDSNSAQINTVINSVKTGIQQYLSKINPNNQVTSSSLGNKNMPLSVNLNLGGSSSTTTPTQGISFFDNVTGSTTENDIISILDKYNPNPNTNNSQTSYSNNSLENQLNETNNGCKLFNINDYMSNRVSTCNCKL